PYRGALAMILCPSCQCLNADGSVHCERCHYNLAAGPAAPPTAIAEAGPQGVPLTPIEAAPATGLPVAVTAATPPAPPEPPAPVPRRATPRGAAAPPRHRQPPAPRRAGPLRHGDDVPGRRRGAAAPSGPAPSRPPRTAEAPDAAAGAAAQARGPAR